MNNNWRISVVGAFDRFNYGDVLFAKIAELKLSRAFPSGDISFYALKESDLTAEGGVKTKPLRDLFQLDDYHAGQHLIVLAGGELLAPSWALMAEHLVPRMFSRQLRRIYKRLSYARCGWFWQKFYACPNLQPWTIDPNDFKSAKDVHVVYNAVGGATTSSLSAAELKWQTAALGRAAWLTTRDHPTSEAVLRRGLPKPEVVPDSAVIMNSLVSSANLLAMRNDILMRSGMDASKPYICFQIADRWARGHEEVLGEELKRINQTTGYQVLSFAIGRAPGHDDHFASRRLKSRLEDESWFYEAPRDLIVNEIMALIAGSCCYIGTSLHGYITAFVYGKPRVGLLEHLSKVTGFRNAWDLKNMPAGISFPQMSEAANDALAFGPKQLSTQASRVEAIYIESFEKMKSKLCSAST